MRSSVFGFVGPVLMLAGGCDVAGVDKLVDGTGAEAEPAVTYESPEEERYCRFGDRFVERLLAEDYSAAYELCSSHLKHAKSLDEFIADRKAKIKEFGKPLRAEPISYARTEPEILRGPDAASSDGLTRVEASMVVGEVTHMLPDNIRRAALQVDLSIDPATMPDPPEDLLPDDEVTSYLLLLVVEEAGDLRIGNIGQRWPNILD